MSSGATDTGRERQIKHHKGSTKGDSASDVNPYPQQTEGEKDRHERA